ncbi:OprD family outer membrane porin [Gillisia sp. Hel_I_29]|uniref:OprD family outer membrane porin n=1 Tax=Gillisia sp. Hel_I_29 TaxID=1249975 RepID=UPI000557E122|nr:OprD family outer membrane porin [Gillisia sp. Hel_I_29]
MNFKSFRYFLLLFPFLSLAQESEKPTAKGKLSGQWRTYYMNTFNKGDLKDFTALATGGHIKYELTLTEKLTFGGAVYNSNNLNIQDLRIPDNATGKLSRYEEGLFDRIHLDNKYIFILGELYANYKTTQHEFTLGRMKIKSPLVNPQDGRMIPTLAQGLLYTYNSPKNNKIQAGVFNQIAPRSTGEFYSIGESIGTYGVGRNNEGTESLYGGNTQSDYLAIINADFNLTQSTSVEFWNYYTDNVSNTLYIKPKYQVSKSFHIEAEWLHQNRINNGGNAIDSLSYFQSNSSDNFGIKAAYDWSNSSLSLSYNRITKKGQFVFPREWGREFLFSFQKRERSEGTGDNHALVLYYTNTLAFGKEKFNLKTIFSAGHQWKPSVLDPILNKYAVPDYTHINLDLFFDIKKWKNLKPELLFVGKFASGDFPDNPNFYLNKTDLFHVDLILNYNF